MTGVEQTPVDFPDFDMDAIFANTRQGQAIQAAPSGLPTNTKGPYYDPEIQWHVKSTLPGATPLPPPADPNFTGPYYAPEVGWHYKMLYPPGAPQMAPSPFAMPQVGFTPSTATPFSSVMPSRTSTPAVPPVAQSNPAGGMHLPPLRSKPSRKKPKYGPAAYLAKNSGGATSIPPRAASISEAHYTSAAKRRADDLTDPELTPRVGRSKRKYPSIVQACICSDKPAKKVKRPRNAFILYRSARKDRIMKDLGSRNNQTVSRMAAQMWKDETDAVRQQYHNMAEQEAARHRQEHPDYKYEPGMKERAKFGSQSCTCGAYRINMANLMSRRSGGSIQLDGAGEVDESGEDSDAYVPPRTARSPRRQTQAPVAPMMQSPLPDPSTFGFMPAQQAEAEAHLAQLKRKRAANTTAQEVSNDPPLAKRLRSTNTNYTFTEPADLDMDDDDDVFAGMGLQLNAAADPDSPPAANTRRATKARISLSPPGTALGDGGAGGDGGVDYGSFFQKSPPLDWDQLMAYDDDNIVVAPRSGSQESQSHSYSLRSRGGSKSPPQL